MNFGDSFKSSNETDFISRLLGVGILASSAANWMAASTDAAYWNCLVTTVLVSYFGPYKATQLFECTPMHKMPEVLMPALLVMAGLAYF